MKRNKGRWTTIAVAFTAIVASTISVGVLAAESSGATAKAAKATWVIGNIGTYSGSNSSNFIGGNLSLLAWADYTNAHGGINGHKVKVIVKDDGGSPSTALNDVKQLVNSDHVLAIVADNSAEDATFNTYLESADIPVLGGSTPLPSFFTEKNYFPIGATSNESVPDLLLYAKNVLHQTTGAYLYCVEAPVCSQLLPVYQGAYTAIGGTLAVSETTSVGDANFDSQCLAAQAAKAQDLEFVGPSFELPGIASDCATLGYDPTLLNEDVVLTPALATQLGTASAVFAADAFPFTATSAAAGIYHSALEKYEPSVLSSKTFTQDDADSWASGELFEAAAKAGDLGNKPTRAQLMAGLYKLKGATLGGLTPPLTFTKNKPNSVSCIFILDVDNGNIELPQGLTPYCPAS
jgi:branched-chain amino acid transport system substrate-binding protein